MDNVDETVEEAAAEEAAAEETDTVEGFDQPLYTGHDDGHVLHDSGE